MAGRIGDSGRKWVVASASGTMLRPPLKTGVPGARSTAPFVPLLVLALIGAGSLPISLSAQPAASAANGPATAAQFPTLPPRKPAPVRPPDAPGTPVLTPVGAKPGDTSLRGAPGMNPPADVNGDFLIGPDYVPAPELTPVAAVPKGRE